MNERKRYPSDLTDERWALIEPVITAQKAAHRSVSGHQGRYEMGEIVNAILYQSRADCQWDHLPPRSVAYCYFAKWRDDGTHQAIHDLLRWHARRKRAARPIRAWSCWIPKRARGGVGPGGHDRERRG